MGAERSGLPRPAWALTPYILGSASIFHPTWLDALAWTSFLYVAVRLLVRREPRLWLLLGLIAGVGLEAKYTIGFLVLAFVAALILGGERRQLLSVWPWLGLAIAVALLAPNLVWQVQHGWPSVHFFSSQNAQTASGTSRPAYIAEQLLFLGATGVLAAAGVVWLWRRGLRALALIPIFVTALFLLERGRSYYPLPADALAVAAGAVAVEGWLRTRARLGLLASGLALQAAVIALAGPIVIPFYSTRQLVNSSIWKIGYFKDEIGWPNMTAQVEHAWSALPAAERSDGAVLAQNYGEASALAALRPRTAPDSQRTPQLAVLAPRTTPAALHPHRRLRRPRSRAHVQLVETARAHRQPVAPQQSGTRPTDRVMHAGASTRFLLESAHRH